MDAQPSSPTILIVDDEEPTLRSIELTLRSCGYSNVLTCQDGRLVGSLLQENDIRLILLDLMMPHLNGEELLAHVVKEHPNLPVVVFTAEYDARVAVRCMKLGAIDYILKPVEYEQLVVAVDKALELSALEFEASRLRELFFEKDIRDPSAFSSIITADPAMFRLFGYLEAISRGSHPVLICGETGTGKELVAKALHRVGGRGGEFVGVNVAGLDDAMFSDSLFGHKVGAFTGAGRTRRGMIEAAGEGTLFLDEIGDLTEASQVKLLRLLEEREYYPLGSDVPSRFPARVITATHEDPKKLRQDLYYRLRTYQISVPPLRERMTDLPLLVDHFLDGAAKDLNRKKPNVPPELYLYLSNYAFPGNVRELQGMVFDAVAKHDQPVLPLAPFLEHIEKSKSDGFADPTLAKSKSIVFPSPFPTLKEIEDNAIAEALRRTEGNQSAAARMLGVSRPTIGRRATPPSEEPEE